MTSRNEDRLGPIPIHNEEQPEEAPNDSLELSFVVPTDFVTLPSGGTFYAPSHPLHNQETIEVKYMTAKEEDILTSRNLLEKGIVLDRLVQSIILNKKIKVEDLLVSDKSAILINARKNGYGADYSTSLDCPECAAPSSSVYDLENVSIKKSPSVEKLAKKHIRPTDTGTFIVVTPVSDINVEIRLLTGRDEHNMMKRSEFNKKKDEVDHLITDQLTTIIVSINDRTDKNLIKQFVESLTLRDTKALREAYETVTPDINMRKEFVCSSCGYEDIINFPVTTDFFWPQQ